MYVYIINKAPDISTAKRSGASLLLLDPPVLLLL